MYLCIDLNVYILKSSTVDVLSSLTADGLFIDSEPTFLRADKGPRADDIVFRVISFTNYVYI